VQDILKLKVTPVAAFLRGESYVPIGCCYQHRLWSQHDDSPPAVENQGREHPFTHLRCLTFTLIQGMSEAKVEKIKVRITRLC
jgi:hypothetical protein